MKKLTASLFATSLILVLCGVAYADSCGMATVPGRVIRYGGGTSTNIASTILLSNITDEDIDVTVDFYDQDGNLLPNSMFAIYKGSNTVASFTKVAENTNTFTIPPHATRAVQYHASTGNYYILGHALIKWESLNSAITKALIGSAESNSWYNSMFHGWKEIPINNGNPF